MSRRIFVGPLAGRRAKEAALPEEEDDPWRSVSQAQFRKYEPVEVRNSRPAETAIKPKQRLANKTLQAAALVAEQQEIGEAGSVHPSISGPSAYTISEGNGTRASRASSAKEGSLVSGKQSTKLDGSVKSEAHGSATSREGKLSQASPVEQAAAQPQEQGSPLDQILAKKGRRRMTPGGSPLQVHLLEAGSGPSVRNGSKADSASAFTASDAGTRASRASRRSASNADSASAFTVSEARSHASRASRASGKSNQSASMSDLASRPPTADSGRVAGGLARRRCQAGLKSPSLWEPDRLWLAEVWERDGPAGVAYANMAPSASALTLSKYGDHAKGMSHLLSGVRDATVRERK